MANNHQINLGIGFQVDKAGLNDLTKSLRTIQVQMQKAIDAGNITKELKEAGTAASQLEDILNSSWNSKLNQLDLNKVNQGIKQTFGNVSKLKQKLAENGPAGTQAFNKVASAVLNTNLQLKQSNKLLDEMATSMANTVKWGITSAVFNNISGAIQQAYGYTKRLDSSLNDIRIVTDKSAESMEKFAIQANEAAKGLGASTIDYTDAALIYYQQGLSDEEAAARAEVTLKAANVTGQSGAEVSEQLTSVWNGYKVTAEEAELYIDKLAAVAASTASDLEELSTGMSKVASAANSMGVDIDQLNAQLATIVSVTRQAPESVGTALKTIYARMSDLKLGGADEDGLSLGDVSGTMESMGVSVLDETGNLREMGDVIEEVATKWNTWTEAQRTAMAQVMAGKRQYNNLVALFENWDMYTNALETSANAAGTLQKQQDTYMESMEAHLQQLRTEAEETYDILFDSEVVNGFTDALTGALDIFNNFIKGIGGGAEALTFFGSVATNVFKHQIAKGIQTSLKNFEVYKNNLAGKKIKEQFALLAAGEAGVQSEEQIAKNLAQSYKAKGEVKSTKAVQEEAKIAREILKVEKSLTVEQHKQLIEAQQQIGALTQQIENIEKYKDVFKKVFGSIETSSEDAQEYLDQLEENIAKLKKTSSTLTPLITKYENNKVEVSKEERIEDLVKVNEIINDLAEQRNETVEQLAQNLGLELVNGQTIKLTSENLRIIYQDQLTELQEQNNTYQNLQDAVQNRQLDEEGVTEQLKEQKLLLQQQSQQELKEANRQKKIEGIVSAASTIVGTITSIVGGLSTALDEESTKIEQISGAGSAVTGVASAIATFFGGPFAGLIVSTIGNLITDGFVKQREKIEKLMKESAEKWEELQSAVQIRGTNIENLESLETEYERLSEGVGKYGENISLTTAEYEKYQDILSQIVDINPDIIAGYDAEGKAIVDINKATGESNSLIEEQIKLLKEKNLQEQRAYFYDEEAMKGFFTKTQEDYDKAEKEAQGKKNVGNANKANAIGALEERITSIRKNIDSGDVPLEYDENKIVEGFLDKWTVKQNENGIETTALLENKVFANQDDFIEDYKKFIAELERLGMDQNQLIASYENIDQYLEYVLIDPIEAYEKNLEAAGVATETAEKAQKDFNDKVFSYVQAFNSNFTKEKIDTSQSQLISNYIQSFSSETMDQESFDELTKKANEFVDLVADLDEETVNKINDLADPNNFDTYQQYLNEVTNFKNSEDFKNSGLTTEQFDEIINSNYNQDEILKKAEQIKKTLEEIYGEEFASLWGDDFNIFDYFSADEILNAEGVNIGGLQLDAFKDIDSFKYAYENLINISNAAKEAGQNFNSLTNKILIIDNALAEFQKEGEMSAETIAQLEKIYPELANIQDKTSHEYLQRLREIREQEEDNAKAELENQKEALKRKAEYYENLDNTDLTEVQIEANTKEYEETMKELADVEHKIEVQVEADFKSDLADAFGIADELNKINELIAEDLTISFEDAQTLIAQGYGELLQNAKETSEQSIMIDQATMQAFVANKQAEIEADRQSKISQLESQREVLVAQKQALENKLAALKEAASAESGVEAANALLKAQNAETEYQNEVDKFNAILDSQEEKSTEEENINAQLFDSLGGMYETNNENLQSAESAATNQQKVEISRRIANVNSLFLAYKSLGMAVKQSATGEVTSNFIKGATLASSGIKKAKSKSVEKKGIEKNNLLSQQDIFNETVKTFDTNKQQFDATMNALIDSTEAQIKGIDSQIGSIDAGIAALKSANNALENKKTKAGKDSGSGGDSEERDEEFKDPSEEIDRYWELNTAIENINESLDDLQKKQDKLHGKQLIESLKKENELLDKQIKAYQALAEEQEKESKEIQAVLSTYGVVFDSEGGIANYLEASNAALSRYNQAVLNYNSFSIDEAALQTAEADYENFKSQLERYEELYYNEMVDTQNQLDDIRTQKIENNLETWEIALDLQLDLSEAERDWNDFLKDINEDFKTQYKDIGAELANIFSNASTYTIDGGTIKSDIKALQDVMAEIDKLKINEPSDMFSSMSEAQEKLKELMETMQDDASTLYDLYGSAWDTFISGIDQSSEKFDDLTEQFERIDDELTYQGELIELLYGQEAYSLLDNLYKAQEKNSLTQIDSLKQQKDMWFELWQNAEEGSEEQAKYYELWTKAQDSLNDKVTEYIELLKTDYMNTVDDILKKLEKGLTGSSIEDLSDEWEKMTEKSDKYLDSIEGLYEIQTLANKINDSITTTSSLKNQQKLQALYDKEIDYLREKENLTQYDLDAAEARYQIALKEIALEEAQNSKNTMKLTRGTDGNWSYQYVADEDVVASKQQELTDAYNELYQLSQDAYTSNLEGLKDLQANYLESYREIMENEILSTEEKEEKILELQSYYLEQYGLLSEENTLYRNDLAIASSALLLDLYNQDQENFEAMTEAEKELVQGLVDQNLTNFMDLEFAVKNNYDEIGYKAQEVMTQTLDQWTSGAQQIADAWNADDGISVKDQILNAEELIWNALDDYQIKVDELAQVVEQNFGEDGITGAIRGAEAATNDLNNAMDSLVSDTIEQLYGYRSALEDIENIWYLVKDSILEATDAAKNYMGLSADNQTSSSDDNSSSNSVSNSPSSSDSNPDGGTGGDGDLKVGDTVTYTGGTYYYDSYGTAPMGNRGPGKQVKVTQVKTDDRPYPIHVQSTDSAYGWLKKDQLTGYDTGGYTGDWQGDDGKLALLHQKEIILNAEDTKNILDAVQTVRDMSALSSSIEEMIMKNISSMIMKMSNLNSNTNYTTTENTNNSTENIYHISAEFPNANDVSSIKEALLSLPNIVSQRIAENKK